MAMMATAARSALRLRKHRQLFADDIFLLFACSCLIAATVIMYRIASFLYLYADGWWLMQTDVLEKRMGWGQRMAFTFIALTWTAIYSVKFSFLWFFRHLIDRVAYMPIYWRVVAGVTVVGFGFCVVEIAIGCPWFDGSSRKCSSFANPMEKWSARLTYSFA